MRQNDLVDVAQEVGRLLADYAAGCAEPDARPADVARAGEAAVDALLRYERELAAQTGWSNPLRHLGPVTVDAGAARPSADGTVERRVVDVRYEVAVDDAVGLSHLAEGRGARGGDVATSLTSLVLQDGWDPSGYPSGTVRLLGVDVRMVSDTPATGQAEEG